MYDYKITLLSFFSFLLTSSLSAQSIIVDNSKTPQELVEDFFYNNTCVQPFNVSVSGYNFGNGEKSYAYFQNSNPNFPFYSGIILSTGKASNAVGPNNSLQGEGPTSWAGDSSLEQAIGETNTVNATVLEFDFVAITNYMSFNYVFSSEQYLSNPNSNQCNFSDGFAFLLKPLTSPQYQNLAVIPGTNIPVKVTTVRGPGTVCPPAHSEYFGGFNGTNHPTNFNGQTVRLKAEANIVPGTTYHIKMVIADQGNPLYDSAVFLGSSTFTNDYAMGEDRLISNGNPLCPGETLTISPDYLVPGALNYTWFKDEVPIPGYINVSSPSYTIDSPGVYQLQADVATCIINGFITVEYSEVIANDITLISCVQNNASTSFFNLAASQNEITNGDPAMIFEGFYYNLNDAQNQQNLITNPSNFTGSNGMTIYARIKNQFNCVDFAEISIQLRNSAGLNPINPLEKCDSDSFKDGFFSFDLDEITQLIQTANPTLPANSTFQYFENYQNAQTLTNPLTSPYTNTVANMQNINVRIENDTDSCYSILTVVLNVRVFDPPDFEDENRTICEGNAITLNPGSGFDTYLWNTNPTQSSQSITVNTAGTYSVTVTDSFGCQATKNYIVIESEAPTIEQVITKSFSGSGNSITVIVSGNGNYEYSIDNLNFQNSNYFAPLNPGEYTVYVRDINGCGSDSELTYILDYPRFFSPNGDNYNDIWRVENLEKYFPNSIIYIFDRYGKLIKQLKNAYEGWDGIYNSNPLPATDYWFTLEMGNNYTVKGHFSLIR